MSLPSRRVWSAATRSCCSTSKDISRPMLTPPWLRPLPPYVTKRRAGLRGQDLVLVSRRRPHQQCRHWHPDRAGPGGEGTWHRVPLRPLPQDLRDRRAHEIRRRISFDRGIPSRFLMAGSSSPESGAAPADVETLRQLFYLQTLHDVTRQIVTQQDPHAILKVAALTLFGAVGSPISIALIQAARHAHDKRGNDPTAAVVQGWRYARWQPGAERGSGRADGDEPFIPAAQRKLRIGTGNGGGSAGYCTRRTTDLVSGCPRTRSAMAGQQARSPGWIANAT